MLASFALVNKQDGRLPPAYFAPSQFGKDAILKDENVFFTKKNFFFITFKVLWFFAKKTS